MSDTSNRIADLHPSFQSIAVAILEQTTEAIRPSLIRPAVTFRSMADQAAVKASGLSKVSLGWHQFGLAMDVAVISETGAYITNGQDERYKKFGAIAKSFGCVWGGDWHDPDWDHCQMDLMMTALQYATWLEAHRVT